MARKKKRTTPEPLRTKFDEMIETLADRIIFSGAASMEPAISVLNGPSEALEWDRDELRKVLREHLEAWQQLVDAHHRSLEAEIAEHCKERSRADYWQFVEHIAKQADMLPDWMKGRSRT